MLRQETSRLFQKKKSGFQVNKVYGLFVAQLLFSKTNYKLPLSVTLKELQISSSKSRNYFNWDTNISDSHKNCEYLFQQNPCFLSQMENY